MRDNALSLDVADITGNKDMQFGNQQRVLSEDLGVDGLQQHVIVSDEFQ